MEQSPAPESTRRKKIIAVVAACIVGLSIFAVAANQQLFNSGSESTRQPDSHIQKNAEEKYPVHKNIAATVFWVGEAANNSNDNIDNLGSYWTSNWVRAYGGIDNPEERCGFKPCDFTPQENPFYFALPFGEFGENGTLKDDTKLNHIPWHTGSVAVGESLLKNRWIKITRDKRTAYAQWQDVGPFETDDVSYVFGSARPKEKRAGIDLSPAAADFLRIKGRGTIHWTFVDAKDVPKGPWKEVITTSDIDYSP
jgi:hypothetical protein